MKIKFVAVKKPIVILLIAVLIRLLGIASRPLWYDEAIAILLSEKGLAAMLYGTLAPAGAGAANVHPLGYHTLLWLWMNVFGESLVAVRLLSVVAGVTTVYLVYLIALEASGDRVALLSMIFAALAPFQVHYSQEIRMYSFMTMWVLLATYAYQRGIKTKDWKWWLLFSFAAAAAQYTHHLAAFYLIVLALWTVLQANFKAVYQLAASGMGALIVYLPWAIHLPSQFAKVNHSYWVEKPQISKFFTLMLVYTANTPLPGLLVAPALFLGLGVVMIAMTQTVIARATSIKTGLYFFCLAFVPPILLFLFSQWTPVYIERALLPSGAIFCIWMAWVITSTKLSRVAQNMFIGMLAVLSFIGLFQHITYKGFPYGPYKELDMSLRQRVGPGDVIVHASKISFLPAVLFDRTLAQKFISDPSGCGQDTLAPATQEVLGIRAEKNIISAVRGAERIWFIMFWQSPGESDENEYASTAKQYLDAHYYLQSVENWDNLRVYLYETDIQPLDLGRGKSQFVTLRCAN
jgi:4-amino-4-deoxy-L-arabinose transferase-like glycosyltransferase